MATGNSVKDVRMDAQELALRFILFYRKYIRDKTLSNYSGNIESELNSLTEELSQNKTQSYSEFIQLYDNAMKIANYLFDRYTFRKCKVEDITPTAKRKLINKALFVSWSIILCGLDFNLIRERCKEGSLALPLAQKITEDDELFLYLTYGTNSKANIQAGI